MRISLALSLLIVTAVGAQDSVTDATGRTVRVPAPAAIKKVFPAGPPAAVLVFTLAPDKLLGWPMALSEEARAFLPPPANALPKIGRLSGKGSTANVEDILKAGANLVVDVGTVRGSSHALAKDTADRTGLPTLLLDGSFEGLAGTYRTLGRVLGVPERGEKLAVYIEKTLASVRDAIARAPARTPFKVYHGRGPKALDTATAGSINAEVLERVGAFNVGAAAGPWATVVSVSPEDLVKWKPDVIILSEDAAAAHVRSDPVLRQLSAVRRNGTYQLPMRPFGWIDYPPAVNRLLGLQWMARLLHPRAFPADFRARLIEFHELFYGQKPTPAQLETLLKGITR